MDKKTVVIGASPKPVRFSHQCVKALVEKGHTVVPIGKRDGEIAGIPVQKDKPKVENVHTVTLYIGAKNQPEYYDYILDLTPERLIFNPGTENDALKKMAEAKGITTSFNCTLMMLASGVF